jgi:hypothetical protein
MTENPMPCEVCGEQPQIETVYKNEGYCVTCWDSRNRVTHRIVGYYPTRDAAVVAWNRAMGEK